jgi:hypothetical protein
MFNALLAERGKKEALRVADAGEERDPRKTLERPYQKGVDMAYTTCAESVEATRQLFSRVHRYIGTALWFPEDKGEALVMPQKKDSNCGPVNASFGILGAAKTTFDDLGICRKLCGLQTGGHGKGAGETFHPEGVTGFSYRYLCRLCRATREVVRGVHKDFGIPPVFSGRQRMSERGS